MMAPLLHALAIATALHTSMPSARANAAPASPRTLLLALPPLQLKQPDVARSTLFGLLGLDAAEIPLFESLLSFNIWRFCMRAVW